MKIEFNEEKGENKKSKEFRRKKNNQSIFVFISRILLVSLCIDLPVWGYFHFVEKTTVFQGLQNLGMRIRGEKNRDVSKKTTITSSASAQVEPVRQEREATPQAQTKALQQAVTYPPVQMDQAESDFVMAENLIRNDRMKEAVDYYRRSARAGNIKAQRALADLTLKINFAELNKQP